MNPAGSQGACQPSLKPSEGSIRRGGKRLQSQAFCLESLPGRLALTGFSFSCQSEWLGCVTYSIKIRWECMDGEGWGGHGAEVRRLGLSQVLLFIS